MQCPPATRPSQPLPLQQPPLYGMSQDVVSTSAASTATTAITAAGSPSPPTDLASALGRLKQQLRSLQSVSPLACSLVAKAVGQRSGGGSSFEAEEEGGKEQQGGVPVPSRADSNHRRPASPTRSTALVQHSPSAAAAAEVNPLPSLLSYSPGGAAAAGPFRAATAIILRHDPGYYPAGPFTIDTLRHSSPGLSPAGPFTADACSHDHSLSPAGPCKAFPLSHDPCVSPSAACGGGPPYCLSQCLQHSQRCRLRFLPHPSELGRGRALHAPVDSSPPLCLRTRGERQQDHSGGVCGTASKCPDVCTAVATNGPHAGGGS